MSFLIDNTLPLLWSFRCFYGDNLSLLSQNRNFSFLENKDLFQGLNKPLPALYFLMPLVMGVLHFLLFYDRKSVYICMFI